MAERSYSKPHSVGFETVKSSKGFPAARCAATASLSRFGARFQLVRFANILKPRHYRGRAVFVGAGLQTPSFVFFLARPHRSWPPPPTPLPGTPAPATQTHMTNTLAS